MSFDPNKITFFAKTDARGGQVPFGIKAQDRTRHMYVIGKTGMGKSTLLENMAVQDIQNGEGLAFIDPHGQTAETLLDYIPEHRKDDVLYFAPFDMEHPVSFNVMEDVGPDKRHLVVSGLMSTFKKIWVDAWSARMEYILSNTLLALLEYPGSTLLGVNRMLSDKHYRKKVIDNIKDPAVKSFWVDEFLQYNERYMQEAGDAIKNKIGQFTANPLIRNIIGQPKSSFDVRTMMDEKKILIVNLSKGLIGETNANLLGSMLITRIYLSAMSRADLPVEKMKVMPNYYFYVDEFQSFANETFANILSEARKYKLNLTIAHQYIEQMEEEVRNAVFGNVGTIVAFRVGPFDAEVLETIFQPRFMATDIVNLGFAQIYLTLMIDGIGSQPFSAVTLPPITQPHVSCKGMVIASSREKFTRTRVEVEKIIDEFHAPVVPARGDASKSVASRPGSDKPQGKPASPRQDAPRSDYNKPRTDAPAAVRPPREGDAKRSDTSVPTEVSRPKPKQPDLNDLRSTLRSIVGTEQKKDTKEPQARERNAVREHNQGQKEPKPLPAKNELKDALAHLIKKAPTNAQQDHAKPDSASQKPQRSNAVPPPAAEAPPPKQAQEERNDSLSPKQLERMMRVTTHDKSPLK